jgi:putative transposase
MGLGDQLMKIVVKIRDAVALAHRFETSPREALQEVVAHVRAGVLHTLEEVMEAEIGLFLGQPAERGNKRNGYVSRTFGIKGLGAIQLRVPRDRAGRFDSRVVPADRHYDEAIERDLALLHLAGLSTRMLAHMSERIVGVKVSHTEVSRSIKTLVPAAKRFLDRPLGERRYKYLYVDGTFFHVRRTTVDREPTLVVLGVDESDRRSILAMIQGDKDAVAAWRMVFATLKERGLDASAVELGIMDGLPGLQTAFAEAFRNAKTARCWVHKSRNVMPLVPRRYQKAFTPSWSAVAYAKDLADAHASFEALRAQWSPTCADAVACMKKDLDALLVHYTFPREHWDALRTTNPIERINKEFKRRSKAMETIGPDGLKVLLAFTALRLEFGWATTPISSKKLAHLGGRAVWEAKQLDSITKGLLQ